jgi:hypothetical protein
MRIHLRILRLIFGVASCVAVSALSPAHAMPPGTRFGLRSPQVPVNGSGLQQLLNAHLESILVTRDQLDVQLFKGLVAPGITFPLQVELVRKDSSSVGLYDGHAAIPTLVQLFPPEATAGWIAVASFRASPTRVIVNVFDQSASFNSSSVTLGGDKYGIGFYVSGPGGTFYSQDARNPGGSPQWLFFAGTGINAGSWWLAAEDQSLIGGAEGDFDDVVVFVENLSDGPYLTPALHSSWGQLKARFR